MIRPLAFRKTGGSQRATFSQAAGRDESKLFRSVSQLHLLLKRSMIQFSEYVGFAQDELAGSRKSLSAFSPKKVSKKRFIVVQH